MRTLRKILAALRNVCRQRHSSADKTQGAEHDDRHAAIDRAIQNLGTEVERQRSEAYKHPSHETQRLVIGWTALAVNLITMGAVICYARVASQQLGAMVAANTHQERTLQTQERAYVHVHRVDVISAPGVGGIPNAKFFYKNTGRTPATALLALTSSFIRGFPKVVGPPEPQINKEVMRCPEPGIHRTARLEMGEVLGGVPIRVEKKKWRILPVDEVHDQPAAWQGGHRRNAPWARVTGSQELHMSPSGSRWAS